MRRLFIHHPLFRLLSPLFSGTLVYLLILLIHNNIEQLRETFLGQELYVCIGLAYLIQELVRLSLLLFKKMNAVKSFLLRAAIQILVSVGATIFLVSTAMFLYFKLVLLYTPNLMELYVFNALFSCIALVYVVLYFGHYFLYRINTEKLKKEVDAKNQIEEDFIRFKKGINPDLLFESLEAMLVLMKKEPNRAEQLSDHFSAVYRYILSRGNIELVPFTEELKILDELVALLNHLPHRKIVLKKTVSSENWVVPASFLTLTEHIVRSNIPSENGRLELAIAEDENDILLKYRPEERLQMTLSEEHFADIERSYSFYTDSKVRLHHVDQIKTIALPKLNYHESSHH
ncbi:histidine kinase [Allomuricauda sp. SCSIO 65647]|uniref:histidine kinase n=1 Tax=Allomuricauda sp. SCSIO 65647 TaxID=2908843 RepID=UPI001F3DA6E0|nr:histidine kinase [Muricauda sp. SCSIO 65647]UJH67331.1 histidine kinase [Muricauda sp. SCSIO 65647]